MIALQPTGTHFNFFENEIRFFNLINSFLRRFSSGLLKFAATALALILLLILSPFLYLLFTYQLKSISKHLANLKAEIPQLSIAELKGIKASFSKIVASKDDVAKLKSSSAVVKPFLLIIANAAEQYIEAASLVDKQIEQDYQLYYEGLEADTPIGF